MTVPEPTPQPASASAPGVDICGLVLAAGAGTRFGGPKALARTAENTPWVQSAVRMLHDAGCTRVLVALGAGAERAAALVPDGASIVVVPDWASGLSATLRAGLDAAAHGDPDGVLITPVDTPDAPVAAARRLIGAVGGRRDGLARAVYDGRPGHPVFVGADHLAPLAAAVSGDEGGGPYLRAHRALAVECGDLWSGADIDRP